MFIRSASFVLRVALLVGLSQHTLAEDGDSVAPAPLNVVLITADDLNYDSVGCYGCEIPDITPNIDGLASEGMLFNHGYVNVAVCQPCRQSIMTGRYPHNNGRAAELHLPIAANLPWFPELLREAGY